VVLSERSVSVTDAVLRRIEEHALEARPAECCGLLSGHQGLITQAHQLTNTADKPETKYFASPEELFTAMRRIRNAGHELLGVYHSHPRTSAYPSPTDVELAFYPEAFYFIISLEAGTELRAFKIEDSAVTDVNIVVVTT
jgi:proteasome lid subunit RPN8/RPN11